MSLVLRDDGLAVEHSFSGLGVNVVRPDSRGRVASVPEQRSVEFDMAQIGAR